MESRYLIMQVPSNMLISSKKVRPSLYMCCCMMAWAVVSACTALAKDYKGLVLVRFFLGIAEAPYYPGALYLLSLFYTRKEIATRLSILYSGNILATSFSGLIAAATFATLDGAHGLTGWVYPLDPLSCILAVANEACVATGCSLSKGLSLLVSRSSLFPCFRTSRSPPGG